MTKLEVELKNKEEAENETMKTGVYLATYCEKNDRLLFFDRMGNLDGVIGIGEHDNMFRIQIGQNKKSYTKLTRVRKLKIEVEL